MPPDILIESDVREFWSLIHAWAYGDGSAQYAASDWLQERGVPADRAEEFLDHIADTAYSLWAEGGDVTIRHWLDVVRRRANGELTAL